MQSLESGAIPPAARAGFERQLTGLRAAEAAGDARIGWKIAVNAPPIQAAFGLAGPLLGHLVRSRRYGPGATISIPEPGVIIVEAEVALVLGTDVLPGAPLDRCAEAIAGVAPALEFLAVNGPIDDLEAAIAGNAFHAAVLIGGAVPLPVAFSMDGLELDLRVAGGATAALDPALVVGEPAAIVRFAAGLLGTFGEPLRAGQVILCGSLNPATRVPRGATVEATLAPLGALSARIA